PGGGRDRRRGQHEREASAAARHVRGEEVAAHRAGQVPADRQAEADAVGERRVVAAQLDEGLEDLLDAVVRDAAARVTDVNARTLAVRLALDRDAAAFRRE